MVPGIPLQHVERLHHGVLDFRVGEVQEIGQQEHPANPAKMPNSRLFMDEFLPVKPAVMPGYLAKSAMLAAKKTTGDLRHQFLVPFGVARHHRLDAVEEIQNALHSQPVKHHLPAFLVLDQPGALSGPDDAKPWTCPNRSSRSTHRRTARRSSTVRRRSAAAPGWATP